MSKPMSLRDQLDRAAELRRQQNEKAAETWYRQVLAMHPDQPEAIAELGAMLQLQGRYHDAVVMADAALAARQDVGIAWMTRGDSFLNGGDAADALPNYERAAEDPATRFDATVRLAKARVAQGQFAEAGAAFEAAVAMRPDSAVALFERGVFRLATRDYDGGWADYESRWRMPRFADVSRGFVSPGLAPHLTLAPTAHQLSGRRVLVVGEQAIGDQVMFASMLPDLGRVAKQVICVCEPRLLKLFGESFPGMQFVHPNNAAVDADMLVAMGSLGAAFRRDEPAFPGAPYLRPSEAAQRAWAERLGPAKGLRVGLSWRGGTPATRRLARSMDLADLAPLLALPQCEFFSLQYGDVQAEVDGVNSTRAQPIRAFPPPDMNDFDALAGLVDQMDIIVSVQTTLVHLAGALGRPCLAMLTEIPEWRYTTSGDRMPWYASVQLVRQARGAGWDGVIRQVTEAVQARTAG